MTDPLKIFLTISGYHAAAERLSANDYENFCRRFADDPDGMLELAVQSHNQAQRRASGLPDSVANLQLPSQEEAAAAIRHQRKVEDELAAKVRDRAGSTTLRLRDESERYVPPVGPSLGERVREQQKAEFERLQSVKTTTTKARKA